MIRKLLFFASVTLAACARAATPAGSAVGAAPANRAAAAAPALQLTYLGVAGWVLSDGAHTVVIDPYLSRPSFADGVAVTSDAAAVAKHAPARADLILIGHSHVDHVLDAPALALRTGAAVLGTSSTINYARAAGVPEAQLITVRGGEDYAFAGFSVRVLPGLHSALDHKRTFGADQVIPAGVLPTTFAQFAEGGTLNYLVRLGGRQVLIIGSANFIEREVQGLRPDAAIVAVGLRQEIYEYTCRLLRALGAPPTVITNHFDAWRAPVGEPLSPEARQDLEAFSAEVQACAPGTTTVVPTPFAAFRL
jgi:L-ascorbate metabolism protein UlaG (beta-lactamase superfamily)